MSEEKSRPDIEKAASEVVFDTLSSLNESMARIARGQQLLPHTPAVDNAISALQQSVDRLRFMIEEINIRLDALEHKRE